MSLNKQLFHHKYGNWIRIDLNESEDEKCMKSAISFSLLIAGKN